MDPPAAKRRCLSPHLDTDGIARQRFAEVMVLVQAWLFYEDEITLRTWQPFMKDVFARSVRSIVVRPCNVIADVPSLNFHSHTCKCREPKVMSFLDVASYPHVRRLFAARSFRHPIFSPNMIELESLRNLTHLYFVPVNNARLKWWDMLPLTLTDLCIIFKQGFPKGMKLNHLTNVSNLMLSANTSEQEGPLRLLPPNLTALKLRREYLYGSIDRETAGALPQSITWLEVHTISCGLHQLPRSLVHLKTSQHSLIMVQSHELAQSQLSLETYVAKYTPPNWTSFVTSNLPNVHHLEQGVYHGATVIPTIRDVDLTGARYRSPEAVCNSHVLVTAMPLVTAYRGRLTWQHCASSTHNASGTSLHLLLPNVQYLELVQDGFAQPFSLCNFQHLVSVHLTMDALTCPTITLPDSVRHLILTEAGAAPIPVTCALETLHLNFRHGIRNQSFSGKLPPCFQSVHVTICYSASVPSTMPRSIQTSQLRSALSAAGKPSCPIYTRVVNENYRGFEAITQSIARNAAGLVDYTTMWGWSVLLP